MSPASVSFTQPELQLTSVAFFGRTFAEYLDLFRLDLPDLADRRILDVAAGPSSFTAEACCGGLAVTAVDPMYGQPVETLQTHVRLDYARMLEQMRRQASLFRPGRFASPEAAEQDRRRAAERFLADYEFGFIHGRYVGAALPQLPFPDRHFDLVLCAHLLFLYARLFSLDWHVAACVELVRVCSGAVMIHPLCGANGQRYPQLDELLDRLLRAGITSSLPDSGPTYFGGAAPGQILVLMRPHAA